MKKHWSDKLVKLSACKEAVIWAQDFPTVTAAWAQCEQGNWMLWLCRQLPIKANSKRAYVQTALAIAESVKQHCAHISEAKLARDATQAWLDNPCAKTRAAAWAARAATGAAAWAAEATGAAAWAAEAAAWAAAEEAAEAAARAAAWAAAEAADWAATGAAAWAAAGAAAWAAAEEAAEAAAGAAAWAAAWAAAEAAQNKIAADIARQYLICPIKDQAVKGRAT